MLRRAHTLSSVTLLIFAVQVAVVVSQVSRSIGPVCEEDSTTLRCPDKHEIRLTSAFYGTTSQSGVSGCSSANNDCVSTAVFGAIAARCDGERTCSFDVINDVMGGDPCPNGGFVKFFEAEWDCIGDGTGYLVVDGCSSRNGAEGVLESFCGNPLIDVASTQCCDTRNSQCDSICPEDDGENVSFYDAEEMCLDFVIDVLELFTIQQLCTAEEIDTQRCCDSGCGYDSQYVWTSTVCVLPTPSPTPAPTPLPTACNAARADDACCTNEAPCGLNEGDCDLDSHCEGNLVCGADNCNTLGLGFPTSAWDCCVQPEAAPPSSISRAAFDEFASGIDVHFRDATNGNLLFVERSSESCEALFDTPTIGILGAGALCHFASPTALRVDLLSDATIVPGDTLTLRSGGESGLTIGTDPEAEEVSEEAALVEAPENPVPPRAHISAPSHVGPCSSEEVTLDASLSNTFSPRPATFLWRATPDECADSLNSSTTTVPRTSADMSQLEPGTVCSFLVAVANWLGVQSDAEAIVRVERVEADGPLVELVASHPSPWLPHRIQTVTANVELPSCAFDAVEAAEAFSTLEFAWSLHDESSGSSDDVVELTSGSTGVTILPYTLKPMTSYSIRLTVESSLMEPRSTSLDIVVGHAPLQAVISGGTSAFEHPVGQPLTLDASASVDFNLPPGQRGGAEAAMLGFEWSCARTLQSSSNAFDFNSEVLGGSDWASCNDAFSSAQTLLSSLVIPENTLQSDYVYRFTVVVSSDDGPRSDARDVFVIPTELQVPAVRIEGPSRLLAGEVLRLSGFAAPASGVSQTQSSFSFSWTEENFGTTSAPNFSSYVRTSLTSQNLALSPGILVAGRTYAFRLEATDSNSGLSGSAVAYVTVASGPIIEGFEASIIVDGDAGEFVAGPNGGETRAENTFRLSVVAYLPSPGESLSYRFAYTTAGGTERLLGNEQRHSFVNVRLPAGDIQLTVYVSSESGLSSSESISLLVPQSDFSQCESLGALLTDLNAAVDSRLVNEAFSLAQILAVRLLEIGRTCGDEAWLNARRSELFSALAVLWQFESYHSIERVQQLAQVIETLSDDTEHFTLRQIEVALGWIEEIFAAVDLSQQQDPSGATSLRFASALANILSNSLMATSISEADGGTEEQELLCEVALDIRRSLSRLLELEISPLLVGESAVELDSGNIVARAIRAASGEAPAEIEVEDSNIVLYVSSGDESGRAASVSFSSYDESLSRCFQSSEEGQGVVGPIVDIDLLECEQLEVERECSFSIDNVSFVLSYEPATELASECVGSGGEMQEELIECRWWHAEERLWRTDGCETRQINVNDNTIECHCEHLTTFAAVKSFRTRVDDRCYGASSLSTFAAVPLYLLYGTVAALSIHQMTRLMRYTQTKAESIDLKLTHILIFVSCLAQALVIATLSSWRVLFVYQLFSVVQKACHFVIFASVAQQWAKMYHSMIGGRDKKRDVRLRYLFTAGAIATAVLLAVAMVLMSVSVVESAAFETANWIGSMGIAIVSLLTAIVFAVYGSLLFRMVLKSHRNIKEATSHGGRNTRLAAQRVFRFMTVLTVTFVIEAVLTILSVSNQALFDANFVAFVVAHLVVTLLSLAAVLTLYANLVNVAREAYQTRKSLHTSREGSLNSIASNSRRGSLNSNASPRWGSVTSIASLSRGNRSANANGFVSRPQSPSNASMAFSATAAAAQSPEGSVAESVMSSRRGSDVSLKSTASMPHRAVPPSPRFRSLHSSIPSRRHPSSSTVYSRRSSVPSLSLAVPSLYSHPAASPTPSLSPSPRSSSPSARPPLSPPHPPPGANALPPTSMRHLPMPSFSAARHSRSVSRNSRSHASDASPPPMSRNSRSTTAAGAPVPPPPPRSRRTATASTSTSSSRRSQSGGGSSSDRCSSRGISTSASVSKRHSPNLSPELIYGAGSGEYVRGSASSADITPDSGHSVSIFDQVDSGRFQTSKLDSKIEKARQDGARQALASRAAASDRQLLFRAEAI